MNLKMLLERRNCRTFSSPYVPPSSRRTFMGIVLGWANTQHREHRWTSSLITGLSGSYGIAVSGSGLFVTNFNGGLPTA